jgi:hypothetical protein
MGPTESLPVPWRTTATRLLAAVFVLLADPLRDSPDRSGSLVRERMLR